MSDSWSRPSRRTLLRSCGLGGTVALAGCLGDGGPPEDDELPGLFSLAGDGTAPFRDWLVPDNAMDVRGRDLLFQYNNFGLADQQGWTDMMTQRDNIAASFGSDAASHEGNVIIAHPQGGQGFIHIGEFDKETIVAFQQEQGNEVTTEYQDFSIVNGQVAIGTPALIGTPEYEQYIDAKNGDRDRLGSDDDDVQVMLNLVPDGVQISVARNPNIEGVTLSGTSVQQVTQDGSFERMIRTLVFEDADTASTDRALEIISKGNYRQSESEEQHGRVVMVEYTV